MNSVESKTKKFGYLLILLGLCIYNSFALPLFKRDDDDDSKVTITEEQKSNIIEMITGVLLVVIGISICFFGIKCFKSMVYGIGFMTGLLLSFACLQSIFGNDMNTILYYVISVIIGIVVGYLAILSVKIALVIVGILAGFGVSALLVSFFPSIANTINPLLLSLIMSVIFIILVFFIEKLIIIISTSVFGSYAIFYGLDCFINFGYATALRTMYDNDGFNNYDPDTKTYLMLIGSLVVAVLGGITQFMTYKD